MVFLVMNLPRMAANVFFVGTVSLLAGLTATILRVLFGRTRPTAHTAQGFYGVWQNGHWLIGKYEFSSFPSGHAATLLFALTVTWLTKLFCGVYGDAKTQADEAVALGQKNIGAPGFGEPGIGSLKDTLATAANLNLFGAAAAASAEKWWASSESSPLNTCDVVSVAVSEDRSVTVTVLFDPDRGLSERIIAEQFTV